MMDENKINLGIDIGGTKINIGLLDEKGRIISKTKIATNPSLKCKETIRQVCNRVESFLKENNLKLDYIHFIGVGVPGTVDGKTGFVDYCPNLNWIDEPVGSYFQKYFGRSVKLVQDSRAAALAEMLFGAGKTYENFVLITIGTGIGGGIVINRKLFNGGMNTAGEIGHMPIEKCGRKCVCGVNGCLEQYAAGSAFIKRTIEYFPEKFNGKEKKTEILFEMAYLGDKEALYVIDECLDDLAFGLAIVVDILSTEAIIVSGGLCEHRSLIIEPLQEKILHYGYFGWTKKKKLIVLKAELGSEAPMVGASALYLG